MHGDVLSKEKTLLGRQKDRCLSERMGQEFLLSGLFVSQSAVLRSALVQTPPFIAGVGALPALC